MLMWAAKAANVHYCTANPNFRGFRYTRIYVYIGLIVCTNFCGPPDINSNAAQ